MAVREKPQDAVIIHKRDHSGKDRTGRLELKITLAPARDGGRFTARGEMPERDTPRGSCEPG